MPPGALRGRERVSGRDAQGGQPSSADRVAEARSGLSAAFFFAHARACAREVAVDRGVGGPFALHQLEVGVAGHFPGEQVALAWPQCGQALERFERLGGWPLGLRLAFEEVGVVGQLCAAFCGDEAEGLVVGDGDQPAEQPLAAFGLAADELQPRERAGVLDRRRLRR